MAKGGPNGVSDLSKAAKHRRDDAQALFDAGRWRGSMYVAGYSVECLLKTKLMQKFRCVHLGELDEELERRGMLGGSATVFTHQLGKLLILTGGWARLRRNAAAWRSFLEVNFWTPAWRYTADLSERGKADEFLKAFDSLLGWVENNI